MIFLSSQEILGVVFCRYDSIVKALNTSNETVLALGANFSLSADSHLVAMQVEKDTTLVFVHTFHESPSCSPGRGWKLSDTSNQHTEQGANGYWGQFCSVQWGLEINS